VTLKLAQQSDEFVGAWYGKGTESFAIPNVVLMKAMG